MPFQTVEDTRHFGGLADILLAQPQHVIVAVSRCPFRLDLEDPLQGLGQRLNNPFYVHPPGLADFILPDSDASAPLYESVPPSTPTGRPQFATLTRSAASAQDGRLAPLACTSG